jgi:Ca2+-binding RTX toxin-like protein
MAGSLRHIRLVTTALIWAVGLLLLPLAGQAQALKCDGKKVTIKGTAGPDHIVGKKAPDVIYGGGGNDHIDGARGNDTICGGPGDDTINGGRGVDNLNGEGGDDKLLSEKGPDRLDGGPGNDYVDGQQGSDRIDGGGGNDKLFGDKGNDKIDGGPGEDLIEGGPGDDSDLEGGPDADHVFGGAGTDNANGGAGDGDVVRGDAGTDNLSGGEGVNDIVSYASATRGGVQVNLAAGAAKGDGHDSLSGFEDVVGSPQNDTIIGDGQGNRLDGGVGNDTLENGGSGGQAFGGPGTDTCNGFGAETSCGPEPSPPPSLAYGTLNQGLDGSSLIIQGSPNDDEIHISRSPSAWVISDTIPIFSGEGCETPPSNGNAMVCPDSGAPPLIVVTGGNGNDRIVVDGSVPAGAHVRINGNAGDDELVGGAGDDVLEAGENYNGPDHGNDTLIGNGGSDVLYADPGADNLQGGPGNDLLVNAVPTCQGNTFDGGPGEDTVSYARSKDNLRIELGGTGAPPGCGNADRILGSNESLEGSEGPDVLVGDNGDNSLMGHGGADVFIGKGGDDFIEARDGQRDKQIDCGGGNDEVAREPSDPRGTSC